MRAGKRKERDKMAKGKKGTFQKKYIKIYQVRERLATLEKVGNLRLFLQQNRSNIV